MSCVTTVSYSILINGVPSHPFHAQKGLRQRDPFSPFLFAISMEYTSIFFKNLQHNSNFKYHPRCAKLGVTHLMFANDPLMFARADCTFVKLLFEAFQSLSADTGVIVNLDKSNAYFAEITTQGTHSLLEILHMPIGTFPFKYL